MISRMQGVLKSLQSYRQGSFSTEMEGNSNPFFKPPHQDVRENLWRSPSHLPSQCCILLQLTITFTKLFKNPDLPSVKDSSILTPETRATLARLAHSSRLPYSFILPQRTVRAGYGPGVYTARTRQRQLEVFR
jgi:hypothetical protein